MFPKGAKCKLVPHLAPSMDLEPKDRFFGDYQHTVDGKNRVTIPSVWREPDLTALFAVEFKKLGIIKLMPKDELVRQGRMILNDITLTPAEAKIHRRRFYGRSIECPMDKEGRVILPSAMLEKLALPKEVVLAGVGELIEVWDRKKWSANTDDGQDELESKMEKKGL